MARNEKTSAKVAAIAGVGLLHPNKLTPDQIQTVCASVLTQAPDRKPKPKTRHKAC